jgi:hypothetical protein
MGYICTRQVPHQQVIRHLWNSWWSLFTPQLLGYWCVYSTRLRPFQPNRRVDFMSTSSTFLRFDSRRFQMVLVCPIDERPPLGGAWYSRASRDGSHPSSSTDRLLFILLHLFYWVFSLFVILFFNGFWQCLIFGLGFLSPFTIYNRFSRPLERSNLFVIPLES